MGLIRKLFDIISGPSFTDNEMQAILQKYGTLPKRCVLCDYHVCAVDGSCPTIDKAQ